MPAAWNEARNSICGVEYSRCETDPFGILSVWFECLYTYPALHFLGGHGCVGVSAIMNTHTSHIPTTQVGGWDPVCTTLGTLRTEGSVLISDFRG